MVLLLVLRPALLIMMLMRCGRLMCRLEVKAMRVVVAIEVIIGLLKHHRYPQPPLLLNMKTLFSRMLIPWLVSSVCVRWSSRTTFLFAMLCVVTSDLCVSAAMVVSWLGQPVVVAVFQCTLSFPLPMTVR
jgi:hypothetical protein